MNNVASLLREKSCYLIDLDGVVYEGSRLVKGSGTAVAEFRRAGKRVFFLTNNSSRHPKSIAEKLSRLGVSCQVGDVLNSALAAALFLRSLGRSRAGKVFVIGSKELRELLREHQVDVTDDPFRCSTLLVGMDQDFDLETIRHGMAALHAGALFVVCNRDANFPGDGGVRLPGCGAIIGALEGASLRRPDVEVGKPSPVMLREALRQLDVSGKDCLVFGDTLESDIAMAVSAGIKSFWVGSSRNRAPRGKIRPTARISSLREAARALCP